MPIVAPIGPSGETVAANVSHEKTFRRTPTKTSSASRIQPMPCVRPRTNWACFDRPPIQTTSSDVKITASMDAYTRTASKYLMTLRGYASEAVLPAGEIEDQVGTDPEQEAHDDPGHHHVAAGTLGGRVPELADDEEDRARG